MPNQRPSKKKTPSKPKKVKTDAIRLFVAVDLDAAVREQVARSTGQLVTTLNAHDPGWKPVAAELLHVTLKFLGDVEPARLGDLQSTLAPACTAHPPFGLQLTGAGAFPDAAHASLLWVGASAGAAELAALASAVETACESFGFAREERPFQTHLTVARRARRTALASVKTALESWAIEPLAPVAVKEVVIYRSDLMPKGPVYTRVGTLKLG